MTEKKTYRSALRSRRFIRQAFMDLLKEKQIDKITVTDIVNRADLNRSTFYAHYADVRGLIEEIQQEFVEQSVSLLKDADILVWLHNPVPFLKKWIEISNQNRELYSFLGKRFVSSSYIEQFKLLLVEKTMRIPQIPEEIRTQKSFEIRVHFFVGGIINVYQQYLVGNLEATSDEIISDIAAVITSSAHTLLDLDTHQEEHHPASSS